MEQKYFLIRKINAKEIQACRVAESVGLKGGYLAKQARKVRNGSVITGKRGRPRVLDHIAMVNGTSFMHDNIPIDKSEFDDVLDSLDSLACETYFRRFPERDGVTEEEEVKKPAKRTKLKYLPEMHDLALGVAP